MTNSEAHNVEKKPSTKAAIMSHFFSCHKPPFVNRRAKKTPQVSMSGCFLGGWVKNPADVGLFAIRSGWEITKAGVSHAAMLSQALWQLHCCAVRLASLDITNSWSYARSLLLSSHSNFKISRHKRCTALARGSLVQYPALDGYILGAIEGEWCSDVMAEHVFRGMRLSLAPYLLELLQERSNSGGMFVLLGMTEFRERFGPKGRCP